MNFYAIGSWKKGKKKFRYFFLSKTVNYISSIYIFKGTHYDEENMLRRLAIFREHNTEDNTMLNFFDELEIHPKLIDVMNYSNDDIEPIYDIACFHLGKPAVFALSYEETMASKKLEMERNNLEAQSGKLAQEVC